VNSIYSGPRRWHAPPHYRDDAARPLTVTAFEALAALDRGLRTTSVSDC